MHDKVQLDRIERTLGNLIELVTIGLRLQGRTIKELDDVEAALKSNDPAQLDAAIKQLASSRVGLQSELDANKP